MSNYDFSNSQKNPYLKVELLNERNLTSHIYGEVTAKAIFVRIKEKYLALFDAALTYMKDE